MSEHKEHKGMSGFFSKLRRKKKEGKLVNVDSVNMLVMLIQ